MRRGWPRTVWWYVTLDMWKLVLLTTAVLAAVIAFAIAVKPLADGKLDPVNALKFMGLAMIPALQYVLPFAACFGATMAYHRLSVDNELTACHAGGISHKSLLMPALLSGILLAACVWGLSNYAIPKFFRQMARILSDDATSLFITRIERGEAIEMGRGGWISADKVVDMGPDEASGAFQRLWLNGVMMVTTDRQGRVLNHGSAKNAAVWLKRVSEDGNTPAADPARRGKSATLVIIKPQNVVGVGGGKAGSPTIRGWGADAVRSFTVPNAFSDDPKFLTFGELSDLSTRPEGMDFVEKRRVNLALVLAQRDTLDQIRSALRTGGKAEFADPFGARVLLQAAELRPTRRDGKRVANIMNIVPPGVPGAKKHIVVERTLPDGKVVRQTALSGYVRLPTSIDPQHPGVYITLHLEDVAATLVEGDEAEAPPEPADPEDAPEPEPVAETGGAGEVKQRLVEDLRFVGSGSGDTAAQSSLDRLMAEPTSTLISSADERIGVRALDADVLRWPRDDLSLEVNKLLREVLSKQHERWAMSLACLVMVVLGAAMAMRLRDALPLTVYVWAFFPAVLAMVAISGGQQMTHKHGAAGLLLLYAGVVGLGIFAAVEYVKASRH